MSELGERILKKLTTRNFMAMSFSITFLYAVIVTVHGESGINFIHENINNLTPMEAVAIGTIGGGIGGVFFKMVSDMVQFYFRASGRKDEEPKTP